MSKEEQSQGFLRYLKKPNIQLVLFLVSFGISSLIFWSITGGYDYWFSARMELLGIFVSTVLTIALIGVYIEIAKRERIQSQEAERQADIQEEQTQIQEEQTELQEQQTNLQETVIELQEAQQEYMEANHKPVVQIVDWDTLYTAEGRDHLELELKNKGNGLAQDLKVKPSLSVPRETPTGDVYVDVKSFLDGGHSPEGTHPFASPVVASTANLAGESGAVLQAGEGDKFRSDIQFFKKRFDQQKEDFVIVEKIPFSEILQEVNHMKPLSVSLVLQYQNVLGEVESKEIYSEVVKPEGAETLEDLI
jgi:hypothetical protein